MPARHTQFSNINPTPLQFAPPSLKECTPHHNRTPMAPKHSQNMFLSQGFYCAPPSLWVMTITNTGWLVSSPLQPRPGKEGGMSSKPYRQIRQEAHQWNGKHTIKGKESEVVIKNNSLCKLNDLLTWMAVSFTACYSKILRSQHRPGSIQFAYLMDM